MYRMQRGGLSLALLILAASGTAIADPCDSGITALAAGFNGTAVAPGNTLWFNSVLKPNLPAGTSAPVIFYLNNATLTLTPKGGDPTVYSVPNAQITYSPGATMATTRYDGFSDTFVTEVPASFGDNTFLTGLALPLPAGLPPGVRAVFSGTFTTNAPGASLKYQFAAAVYRVFSTDYDVLGIKVTHGGPDAYPGGDHAGVPENYARLPKNVIGGGTGGGSGNFTGSYSATATVVPCPAEISIGVS
jgi:hypothetical protein